MAFQFDRQSVNRIAKQTREHERRVRSGAPPIRFYPGGGGGDIQLGKVTETVTAREDEMLGKGKVNLFDVNDDNKLEEQDEPTDVLNFWATEIAKDSYVIIGGSTGGLFVLGRECAEDDEDVTEGT